MGQEALYLVAGFSILLVLAIGFRYVKKLNDAEGNSINLMDLLTHYDVDLKQRRLQPEKVVLAIALVVTSWSFIYATLAGKMTDVMYAAYGTMWIAPLIARNLKADPAPQPTE